jgi:hypothetical protein
MAGRASTHHKSCCNSKPGLDCADWTVPARYQRKLESAWWQRTEIPQPAAAVVPGDDLLDCAHGCNGDCIVSGSDRCNFTCHEQAEAPAVDAGA